METISLSTKSRIELIDITSKVESIVRQSKVLQGLCLVFCPHTTAGLTINENADPSVQEDLIEHLGKLVPANKGYSHLEGNSDSHIKTTLAGSSVNIIIEDKRLMLGTWQGIYFCEFDGPRQRKVWVSITGS